MLGGIPPQKTKTFLQLKGGVRVTLPGDPPGGVGAAAGREEAWPRSPGTPLPADAPWRRRGPDGDCRKSGGALGDLAMAAGGVPRLARPFIAGPYRSASWAPVTTRGPCFIDEKLRQTRHERVTQPAGPRPHLNPGLPDSSFCSVPLREGLGFSLCSSLRRTNSSQGQSGSTKEALKKPKLPQGRLDVPEDSSLEQEPLEKFPDDINPLTKEKGGPRGPEPTRYGDWERKGRCVDF
ncbi:succinate dehydrogenase assembly factor 4, mitochondrial [Macrotis lagotis]|uniref:succinate dehydrogenase assembly factor 4, mitochondrial n=1 Tax=Macrotis lagotis TaxID=92651 RepID=UPI003D68BB90